MGTNQRKSFTLIVTVTALRVFRHQSQSVGHHGASMRRVYENCQIQGFAQYMKDSQ